jgi:hypothetical protein
VPGPNRQTEPLYRSRSIGKLHPNGAVIPGREGGCSGWLGPRARSDGPFESARENPARQHGHFNQEAGFLLPDLGRLCHTRLRIGRAGIKIVPPIPRGKLSPRGRDGLATDRQRIGGPGLAAWRDSEEANRRRSRAGSLLIDRLVHDERLAGRRHHDHDWAGGSRCALSISSPGDQGDALRLRPASR